MPDFNQFSKISVESWMDFYLATCEMQEVRTPDLEQAHWVRRYAFAYFHRNILDGSFEEIHLKFRNIL